MNKTLCAVVGLLLISCGDDDLESASKFIAEVHDRDNTSGSPQDHQLGGIFEDAYLINKVHVDDHQYTTELGAKSDVACDSKETCTMKVHVNVGYYPSEVDECTGTGIWKVHETEKPAEDSESKRCFCVDNPTAVVSDAINTWLAPLEIHHGSEHRALISKISIEKEAEEKTAPDLIVNFFCQDAIPSAYKIENASGSGCPSAFVKNESTTDTTGGTTGSCTRYCTGDLCTDDNFKLANIATRSKLSPTAPENYRPIPIIYIGPRQGKIHANDTIGEHDKLDLLHQIGQAFGLAEITQQNTEQPNQTIMAKHRTVKNRQLALSSDDEAGVRWLYQHHRRQRRATDCGEDYDYKNNGCVPKHLLITALRKKSVSEARKLLEGYPANKIDLNDREARTDNSALHIAIQNFNDTSASEEDRNTYVAIIDMLLNKGRDRILPNLQDSDGNTPLHLAVTLDRGKDNSNLGIITLLLASPKLEAQVANKQGNTALHLAALIGKPRIISAMSEKFEPFVSRKNNAGKTALHLAAERGDANAVMAFRDYGDGIGALASVADDDGNTALHLAALPPTADHNDVIDTILADNAALLNEQNKRGRTALHLAARIGNQYTVERLLQKDDIQVNAKDRDDNTPLHLAAQNNKPDIVRLLLNKDGIDPTLPNRNGHTARDVAGNKDHREVVAVFDGGDTRHGNSSAQRLIQALKVGNLDPSKCVAQGNDDTPEDLAACRARTALSIIRADDNLDVNYQDPRTGDTALHYAAKGQGIEADEEGQRETNETYELVADLLLRHTLIKPNLSNKRGEAPLHLAVKYEKAVIVRLLLRHFELNVNLPVDGRCETNICGYTALHIAVDLEHEDIVGQLLRYRLGTLDVNKTNAAGLAPLHIAAEQRDDDMTQMLVNDRRVDVNKRSHRSKETALHIAARYDSDEIVRTLLNEADIEINAQSHVGETALHIAAHHGHVEVVRQLLNDSRIDASIRDNKQRSAYSRGQRYPAIAQEFETKNLDDDNLFRGTLMELLRGKGEKNVETIALRLLSEDDDDLDVNEKDRTSGKTPLHYAIEYGYGNLIEQLLQRTDLQVNLKTTSGETPLFTAVRLAETGTISKLLAHVKTLVNEKDNKGNTALLTAVRAKEQAIVRLLLEHQGIDVNLTDRAGNTALLLAVTSKQSSIVAALLAFNNIDVNIRNSRGQTPLLIAVSHNDVATVTALLQNSRIDPNLAETETREENTPLHIAVKQHLSSGQSHIRVILLLLGHSAIRPNTKNNFQESPLLIAVKEESSTLVSNLLQYTNVNVNTNDSRQKTALMYAAERGSQGIANRVVARGAEVNLQDDKKFTALHYAAHHGRVEIVSVLLQASGIDLTLEDKWGLTARERAEYRGHDDVAELIDSLKSDRARTASAVSLLVELARGDSESSIMTIIARGNIKVNAVDGDNNDYTALHYAAQLGYGRVVTALLEYDDIRVNAVDRNSRTALHIAAAGNQLRIVQALLAHSGTNPAAKTRNGFTALHWAAQLGYTDIVRVLLDSSTSLVNMQTNHLRTALHYASWLGQRAIVELLIDQDNILLDLSNDNRDTALHYAAAYNRLAIAESLLEAGASTGAANKQYKTARSLAHEKGHAQMVRLIDRYRN